MAHLGLEVPPGMTITTEVCQEFQDLDSRLPVGLWEDVVATLAEVEADFGHRFAATDQARAPLSRAACCVQGNRKLSKIRTAALRIDLGIEIAVSSKTRLVPVGIEEVCCVFVHGATHWSLSKTFHHGTCM